MKNSMRLEAALDADQFWKDLEEQAEIGAIFPRGLQRLALDDSDIQARHWLIQKGEAIDCAAYYDALGNVFLRREGRNPKLAPLLIGSHLDSQPFAGIYDGTLGVVAGLAVLRALYAAGIDHDRPIEVVSWTNEEGARFSPGASGSSWFAGRRDRDAILATRDKAGVLFHEALTHCLTSLTTSSALYRPEPYVPHAFLELHIEQGPILDAKNLSVCAVSGIQGVNWYDVEVQGQANHAGTTPTATRRDAFMGAHALIAALNQAVAAQDTQVRFTIGKFSVEPDSVNTIPQRACFTIDLRHPEQTVLDALDADFHRLVQEHRWAECTASLKTTSSVSPVIFNDKLVERVATEVENVSPLTPRLVSGAFHDAIHLAAACPTAMLFTACRAGISHHPDEYLERQDAQTALGVLARTTLQLLSEQSLSDTPIINTTLDQ